MLFPPKVELGKATKANVRHCRLLTGRHTTRIKIRGFFFRDKNSLIRFSSCLFRAKIFGINHTTSMIRLPSTGPMLMKTCGLNLVK